MNNVHSSQTTTSEILYAFLPLLTLVVLLTTSIVLFGSSATSGASQVALFCASGIAIVCAVLKGVSWGKLEKAIGQSIAITTNAMLILLLVGTMIGVWIVSGTVPTMIYYGIQIIEPSLFYVTTCIVCVIGSLAIGSSWSVIGSLGLGLFGISATLGLSPEITIGAIVSGAYFGDKMSPLSDTTNLAPAVSGGDIFGHIKNMTWTTIPALLIALVAFYFLGDTSSNIPNSMGVEAKQQLLDAHFSIGPHLLLPVVIVAVLAFKKFPALPSMMLGILAGALVALFFQPTTLITMAASASDNDSVNAIKGLWQVAINGYSASLGDSDLNKLLSRGGMSSMLNTVWLVLSAITFGAIMERAGFLTILIARLLHLAKSTGQLIMVTVVTVIGANVIVAEQYLSIVIPGKMFQAEFKQRGLSPLALSRTLEDAGTVTSALIPWNTCGAFIAGVFGISALAYAPFCLFNILCPILTVIYGFFNIKIMRLAPTENENPA